MNLLIVEGKTNGFFIEAGALDGETHSNTLLFELNRNYSGKNTNIIQYHCAIKICESKIQKTTINMDLERSGLLIEPGLDYKKLLKKHRKVSNINACLAPNGVPGVVEFLSFESLGGIKGKDMLSK